MKSKANIKGHPLHPILICFPVAFFSATLLFDLLSYIKDDSSFLLTAMYLEIAGIAGALAAAIPGIIDYNFTVPPKSSAKKRAAKHGMTNTLMVIIFASALYYRQRDQPSLPALLILETLGIILLFIAGWLGGTLVYNNHIGVINRYADAGKWKEVFAESESNQIEIATEDELKLNQMKLVHVHNRRIVLARTEKGYIAFDDRCTHKGGSLAGGVLICGTVQCPWHGSQFSVETGNVTAPPAKEKIATYRINIEKGKVYLILDM